MPSLKPVIPRRSSGVMLPVFSLPNQLDQGDFGPGADVFLRWLKQAGQSYWMILPLNPVDSTGSPYASSSAFALNPLFISPEILVTEKLLLPDDLKMPTPRLSRIAATRWRMSLLRQAYRRWLTKATASERKSLEKFSAREKYWLDDYALFTALKHRFGEQPRWKWPAQWQIANAAAQQIDRRLAEQIQFEKFTQWLATKQWSRVRRLARQYRIKIIGDVSYTVRRDSADVWSKFGLFETDQNRLTMVGGMPPDAFCKTGQRWGTPVYRWPAHRREKFAWWTNRLRTEIARADIARLDHFQGYIREWAIPVRASDARHGQWHSSPGGELFEHLRRSMGQLPFVVEDLGLPLPASDALRRRYLLPTIRIFQFSWSGTSGNIHALHHIAPDTVFMTANHDLPTVKTWWSKSARPHERRHFRYWLKGRPINQAAINIVWESPATLAITTVADICGLGASARINHPGTKRRNWRWRTTPAQLTTARAKWLRSVTKAAGRLA